MSEAKKHGRGRGEAERLRPSGGPCRARPDPYRKYERPQKHGIGHLGSMGIFSTRSPAGMKTIPQPRPPTGTRGRQAVHRFDALAANFAAGRMTSNPNHETEHRYEYE